MKSNKPGLESLIASIFPVGGMLVVGVIALRQLTSVDIDVRFFLVMLIVSTLGVFFGELFLLRYAEQTRRTLAAELVTVCKDYLAGNTARRATLSGDSTFDGLVSSINAMLDWATVEISTARSSKPMRSVSDPLKTSLPDKPAASTGLAQLKTTRPSELATTTTSSLVSGEALLLDTQVQRLVREVSAVLDDDLRIHATVPPGRAGILADVCNRLVEHLIELVLWTRYSSEQVKETTQSLIDRSAQVAQAAETYLKNFSETTITIEKLVTFMQRLSDTLQLNSEIMREIQVAIQQAQRHDATPTLEEAQPVMRRKTKAVATHLSSSLLARLNEHVERQSRLIEEMALATEEHATEAELMITHLYTFAQELHKLCSNQLLSVEGVKALAALAGKWRDSVISFQLPDDAYARLSLPKTPTSEWIL